MDKAQSTLDSSMDQRSDVHHGCAQTRELPQASERRRRILRPHRSSTLLRLIIPHAGSWVQIPPPQPIFGWTSVPGAVDSIGSRGSPRALLGDFLPHAHIIEGHTVWQCRLGDVAGPRTYLAAEDEVFRGLRDRLRYFPTLFSIDIKGIAVGPPLAADGMETFRKGGLDGVCLLYTSDAADE